MMRHIPLLVFTLIGLVLFLGLSSKDQRDRSKLGGTEMSEPFPSLELLQADSSDGALTAETLKGQVTVVNFLASWCVACASEMDELVALKKAHPNVKFYGIVWNDSPSNMKDWLKKNGNPFDALRYDPKGRAVIALGLRGIPESFIVDGTGTIRYRLTGQLTETLRTQTIDGLLDGLEASHAR